MAFETADDIREETTVAAEFPEGSLITSEWEPSLVGHVIGYASAGIVIAAEDGKAYVLRRTEARLIDEPVL